MKKIITKKSKEDLKIIIQKYGYWSDNYTSFLECFCHTIRYRVHQLARSYEKELC